MPTKANALGRVLRYFGDAFAYAKPVQHSKLSLALLEGMAASPWYLTGGQGDEDEYELATSSYAAYSAIKLVASRATTKDATFQAQREDADGELEEEKAHPFTKLLKRPNTLMSGSFLMRYTVWWFLLRGNAYIFIATPAPGSGEPVELLPLAADMMQPMPETMRQGKGVYAGQQVIDFEYSTGTYKQQLPGENVIHFRAPNPHDYWVGLSPLAPALLPLRSDEAQGQWVSDFFGKKNAIPSAIMSVPAETSEQDFGVIREMLREQFEAGQRTLITRAGDLSVEVIQQTLEQMQVLGSREFNAKAIDRIYGIPEGLITGGLSGDSRLAAEIALARNTVQPLLDYFAEELTGSLAIYYGDDIVITAPNVVPQDRALDLQEYSAYGQDRTINENRQELGLEPLKNDVADQVPVRLLQWVAPNYATLDGSEPEPEPTPAALEPFAQPGQPSTNGNGNGAEPGLPAMEGTATPEQVVEQLAGKAHTNGHDPVATLALRTELQRWRKVAMREAKAGRNPAEREFESAVVPAELAAELRTVLDGADEARVGVVFEQAVKGGPGSGNFGHEGRPGERGGSASGGGSGQNVTGNRNFREFDRVDDAKDWGSDTSRAWREGLSQKELEAIDSYSAAEYWPINQLLRGRDVPEYYNQKEMREKANIINTALSRSELEDDIIAYRGLADDIFRDMPMGSVFEDKGLMSTTLSRQKAEEYVMFGGALIQLRIPKGTKGAFLNGASRHSSEIEVLMATNTRFRLIAKGGFPSKPTYEAEILN